MNETIKEDADEYKIISTSNREKSIKQMIFIIIILSFITWIVTLCRDNFWRFTYDEIAKGVDDRPVVFYELYDKDLNFSFKYYHGKYKGYLFGSVEKGTAWLRHTILVNETDYAGKYLYKKQDDIIKILDTLDDSIYTYELKLNNTMGILKEICIYCNNDNDYNKDNAVSNVVNSIRNLMKNNTITKADQLFGNVKVINTDNQNVYKTYEIKF